MITANQKNSIAGFLRDKHIPSGLGTKEEACSVAAINLALTGELTDEIPPCMSPVIGRWMIAAQDAMPDTMRNSQRWRDLIPLAAGTGRELEKERLDLIMEWMYDPVLATLQPIADTHGFGPQWAAMIYSRDEKTAERAAEAAAAAWRAQAAEAWRAAKAAWRAQAAEAAWRAAEAWRAAKAAAEAAWRAEEAWRPAAEETNHFWSLFDPCGLLEKLINVQPSEVQP